MAKQNNSLTELQALEGIYEHLSAIDDLSKDVNVMVTKLSKIEQSQPEYKTALSTMIILTESMTRSFDKMKKTKAAGTPITVCRKDDINTSVRSEVKTAVREAMSGLEMTARVSEESQTRLDEQINRMTESLKRLHF